MCAGIDANGRAFWGDFLGHLMSLQNVDIRFSWQAFALELESEAFEKKGSARGWSVHEDIGALLVEAYESDINVTGFLRGHLYSNGCCKILGESVDTGRDCGDGD